MDPHALSHDTAQRIRNSDPYQNPMCHTRTPRGLVSNICFSYYVTEYKCMYMYTAVLSPQVYTIRIVYYVRISVH